MKLSTLDKRKRIALYVALNLALLACIPLFFVYKRIAQAYPEQFSCAFLETVGLYCPGCGMTRAITAMLGGHFLTALRAHPGAVVLAVYLAWLDLSLGLAAFGRRPFRFGRLESGWLISVGAVTVVWAILRNILLVVYGYDLLGGIV